MAWVEESKAPDAIVAHAENRARPVFPWPAVTRYDGKGNPAEAASYQPAEAKALAAPVPAWAGQDFFQPY